MQGTLDTLQGEVGVSSPEWLQAEGVAWSSAQQRSCRLRLSVVDVGGGGLGSGAAWTGRH